MAIEFASVLKQAEGMTATGIPVPDDVVAQLGGAKNAAVTVTVRKTGSAAPWYSYPISLASRNGGYIVSFSSANRAASGLVAGDPLEVAIELDASPRTIQIPDDLKSALEAAGVLEKLLALSFSKQRAFVEPIDAAKTADTRTRRIEKVVADLT